MATGQVISIEVGYGLFPSWQSVPPFGVPLGEQIKLRVNWELDTDDVASSSAVVAYKHNDPVWQILDQQTERHTFSGHHSGQLILNTLNMPAGGISLAAVLWFNPDIVIADFPEDEGNPWQQLEYQAVSISEVGPSQYRNLRVISFDPSTVDPGDTVHLTIGVEHRGLGETSDGRIEVDIGEASTQVAVPFFTETVWQETLVFIGVDIPSDMNPGTYDIDVALRNVTGPDLEIVIEDAITVTGEVGDITGVITDVHPSVIEYGQPLDIYVSFNAYNDDLFYQIRGWETKVSVTLDSLRDSDVQFHYGRDGSRTDQSLHLGTMPNSNLTGLVILEGRHKTIPDSPWTELDRRSIAVSSGTSPECSVDGDCPPGYICRNGVCVPEGEPPPGEEFPWLPVTLIVGGTIVGGAALLPKGKGLTKK